MNPSSIRWGRAAIAGVAGGIALLAGVFLFFGPAQSVLADPAHQSPKIIAIFFELEPLPRMVTDPFLAYAGFVLIGLIHGLVFALVAPALPGRGWMKGLSFGAVLWLVMVVWFEFFMLWNVLGEPLPLIALELVLWLLTVTLESLVIALVYGDRTAAAPAV